MSDYQAIQFSLENGIATLTLNRPDAANGMNLQMGAELADAALHCAFDESLRVVVIKSTGKMFCAGGDLKEFASFGDKAGQNIKKLTDDLHKAISVFARMNAPVIIAVNGTAAGAGFSFAVCGDLVVAAQSAKFTMAYTAAGLSPDGSSSYYLPRLIGLRKTQELMITNRVLTANEALDWGLVTQVVPDSELDDTVNKLAQTIASGPTSSYGVVKKLLVSTFENTLETQMELEGIGIAQCANSVNGKEGINAFFEKRKPSFK